MVHYILSLILTMKHVIYGAISSAARESGECCKLPHQGRSPSGNRILAWKSDIWWHQFFIFPDFTKTYHLWPFPDHSNSLTFTSFPWPIETLEFVAGCQYFTRGQLQLATWLLLTAYRNLTTAYPTVPSPTLYDVPFSHNTKRYRQTTERRQTDRTSYHKRNRNTQYGRLKAVV